VTNVRRSVLALGVCVALAIGFVVWRARGGERPGATVDVSAASQAMQRLAARPKEHRTTAWFAQTGLAGRRIAGVVITEDGAPVRGATVRLASTASRAGLVPEARVITDDAGRFDLGLQLATTYVVSAEVPRLTAAVANLDLRDPATKPEELRLIVLPCEASLHGIVRDVAGGTVPHAQLARGGVGFVASAGTEADDHGAYELCLPHGTSTLVIEAEGYASISESVDIYGRMQRDFELAPGATVVGLVVRAEDHAPVEGALVELGPSDFEPRLRLSAASDAEGRFVIEGVAPGRARVRASAEGMTTPDDVEVTAEVGGAPVVIECELVAAYSVSGKVVERGTGRPISGYHVGLYGIDEQVPRAPPIVRAQTDGSFTIDHVLPGEYGFRPVPDLRVKVEKADVAGVVLELAPPSSIAGRVLRDGKPVSGARLQANQSPFTDLTDHEGRYTLRVPKPGTYRISATSDRLGAFARDVEVTVGSGEHKTGVDVNLELAGSIAGIVVDQKGMPVSGVFLRFALLGNKDFGAATTDDDGTFTARGLSGGGDYVYEVRQRAGEALAFPPVTGRRFPPITVADGNTHVTGVRIQVRYERFTITGRVTNTRGAPMADVTIVANPRAGSDTSSPTALSDQTGAFTLRDLPAGLYDLETSSPRGTASVEAIAAGSRDVNLQLVELGSLEGTLEGFRGRAAVRASGPDLRRAAVSGSTFAIRGLRPGKYIVSADTATETGFAMADVVAGAPTNVTVTRHPTGTILGTVVDERTRTPVAGLSCTNWRPSDNESVAQDGESARTDNAGVFRLERVLAGDNEITCNGENAHAEGEVTVLANQTASIVLTAKAGVPPANIVKSGLTFEDQLDEIRVKAVTPGSPGARAGVAVGDIVKKLDHDDMRGWSAHLLQTQLDVNRTEDRVTLVLERGDHSVTVTLDLTAAP
jgi:hypothetical protein